MSEAPAHVALLAPVPFQHLTSAREICEVQGKVAFGSNAFDALHKLTEEADGAPCDVLIYASDARHSGPPKVTWRARFLRWVHAKGGAHPEGTKYRPPTASADSKWAMFWEVQDLAELAAAEQKLISDLKPLEKKTKFVKHFVPLGPIVIEAE